MSVFGLGDLAFLGAAGGVASYDPDAQAYITAVEAADGQALEAAVKDAIDAFVRGCKADGIWSVIKASCILAGARTLNGALVPMVGPAPTNFNFVSGDYNRKTGLVGDGSTKYLDSNRLGDADPLNSVHQSVYISGIPSTSNRYLISTRNPSSYTGTTYLFHSGDGFASSLRGGTQVNVASVVQGFAGHARSGVNTCSIRVGGASTSVTTTSVSNPSFTTKVFTHGNLISFTSARLAFYSIGEALDLALLDARVTTLINAFAAAIP